MDADRRCDTWEGRATRKPRWSRKEKKIKKLDKLATTSNCVVCQELTHATPLKEQVECSICDELVDSEAWLCSGCRTIACRECVLARKPMPSSSQELYDHEIVDDARMVPWTWQPYSDDEDASHASTDSAAHIAYNVLEYLLSPVHIEGHENDEGKMVNEVRVKGGEHASSRLGSAAHHGCVANFNCTSSDEGHKRNEGKMVDDTSVMGGEHAFSSSRSAAHHGWMRPHQIATDSSRPPSQSCSSVSSCDDAREPSTFR